MATETVSQLTELVNSNVNENDKSNKKDNLNESNSSGILELGIRLRIDQLTEIDTSKQEYVIKGMLDCDWIATNEDVINYDQMGAAFKPTQEANIDILNVVSLEQCEFEINPETGGLYRMFKGSDGKDYNRQRIILKGRFTEAFEVEALPFDVQDLSFVFTPSQLAINKCKFVPLHTESTSMSIDYTWSSISDWDIVLADIHTDIVDEYLYNTEMEKKGGESQTRQYVIFRIQVKRRWKIFITHIIAWLFALGIVSFGILTYPATSIDGRLGFAVTMVLTLVAFQFVIQQELPKVSYLTLMDKYNISIFLFNLLLLLESIVVGHNEEGLIHLMFNEDTFTVEQFDNLFSIVSVIVFVVLQIAFIIYAKILYQREIKKIGSKPQLHYKRMTDWKCSRTSYPSV